jgi:hypothetical protein
VEWRGGLKGHGGKTCSFHGFSKEGDSSLTPSARQFAPSFILHTGSEPFRKIAASSSFRHFLACLLLEESSLESFGRRGVHFPGGRRMRASSSAHLPNPIFLHKSLRPTHTFISFKFVRFISPIRLSKGMWGFSPSLSRFTFAPSLPVHPFLLWFISFFGSFAYFSCFIWETLY